jgi:predicted nuclease with TOPRIM domain
MLTFADAKRVIETTKQHSPAIAGLCLELIAMLEENTAIQIADYEKRIKEAEASREKAQLFASSHDCSIELAEAKERIEELEKELLQYRAQKELLQHRAQKKRGRPKKAETYASEVEDLREDFGIKDVAKELANMKED